MSLLPEMMPMENVNSKKNLPLSNFKKKSTIAPDMKDMKEENIIAGIIKKFKLDLVKT